jgi:hypothetical protein
MQPIECPSDCRERHTANRSAIYLALSGIGVLFSLIAALYLYTNANYARATDVEASKVELKDMRGELREEIKIINNKLDSIMDRRK